MSALNMQLKSSDPAYNELHAVLKDKLTEYLDDFDDSLPTYILHLVGIMNKPKEEVLASLKFIGEEVYWSVILPIVRHCSHKLALESFCSLFEWRKTSSQNSR